MERKTLNKSVLCKIVTRELLSEIDNGINCNASESHISWDKYHNALDKIEALGRLCDIEYYREVKKYT